MAITRLSGGLSPADGSDPRTFPLIFDEVVDAVEAVQGDVADNATAIADNATAIADNATAIADNVTAIGANATAIDGKAPLLLVENVQTGDYTLELSDVAKVVAVDSSSAQTVTVPGEASVDFPVGSVVNVYRAGSGGVDLVGASGVTVRNVGSISDQFGEVSLRKRGSDEWVLVGQVD